MKEFQQKRKFWKFVYSKTVLVVLFVIFLFGAKAVFGVYQKSVDSGKSLANTESELQSLKERQQSLDAKMKSLSTEEGVEKEIRNQFSVAKPGEKMIFIVDSDSQNNNTNIASAPVSFWSKILGWFGWR